MADGNSTRRPELLAVERREVDQPTGPVIGSDEGSLKKQVRIDGRMARLLLAGIRRDHPDVTHATEVIERYLVHLETIPREARLRLACGHTENAENFLGRPLGFDATFRNDHGILRIDTPTDLAECSRDS